MNEHSLPQLLKYTKGSAVQTWSVSVECSGGVSEIVVVYGKLGGKQITNRKEISVGKNAGKSNATTPHEQAVAEMHSMWRAQLDRNLYGLTIEESRQKKTRAPMLAAVFADHESKIDWSTAFAQPKFNGHRCVSSMDDDGVVKMISREGVLVETLPEIRKELEEALTPGMTVDGELYIHGTSLQKITSLVKKNQPGSEFVKYYLYDTIQQCSFSDRWDNLNSVVQFTQRQNIYRSQTRRVGSREELMAFQAKAIQKGYEGAMLRHSHAFYDAGNRSHSLLKVKTFFDDEFQIVGAKEGEGLFRGMAIFICDTKRGGTFDVTSPGDFFEKRAFWVEKEKYIGRYLTVKYAEFTQTEDPKPFHPVALQIKEIL